MKIYDRYVLMELTRIFVLAVFGALVVMLGNHLFFELMSLIVDKRIALPVVLKIVVLRIPPIAVISFPLGVLFAAILALSRMALDKEIDAFQTSGMGIGRLMRPIVVFGLVMTVVTFVTNEKVVPWTNHTSQNILRRYMMSHILSFVEERVFIEGPDNRYYYIEKVDQAAGRLSGVLVIEARSGRFPRVITAREGRWVGNIWQLSDGGIWDFDRKGFVQVHGRFETMDLNVEAGVTSIAGDPKQPQEISSAEMIGDMRRHSQMIEERTARHWAEYEVEIERIKESGVDVERLSEAARSMLENRIAAESRQFKMRPEWLTDFHFKFSIPAACLIFAFMAVPLAVGFRGGMPYSGVLFAVLAVAVYYILMSVSRELGMNGTLPPVVAAWSQNAVFLAFGVFLTLRARK